MESATCEADSSMPSSGGYATKCTLSVPCSAFTCSTDRGSLAAALPGPVTLPVCFDIRDDCFEAGMSPPAPPEWFELPGPDCFGAATAWAGASGAPPRVVGFPALFAAIRCRPRFGLLLCECSDAAFALSGVSGFGGGMGTTAFDFCNDARETPCSLRPPDGSSCEPSLRCCPADPPRRPLFSRLLSRDLYLCEFQKRGFTEVGGCRDTMRPIISLQISMTHDSPQANYEQSSLQNASIYRIFSRPRRNAR